MSKGSQGFPYEWPIWWDDFKGQTVNFDFFARVQAYAHIALKRLGITRSAQAHLTIAPHFELVKGYAHLALQRTVQCAATAHLALVGAHELAASAHLCLYQPYVPPSSLVDEQKRPSYVPYVEVHDTGYSSQNRLKRVNHYSGLWKETAQVLLDNSDHALNEIELRGENLMLKWGLIVGGVAMSVPSGNLKVIAQQFRSEPGRLECTLECQGIPSLLANDTANKEWRCNDTYTIRQLVTKILNASLPPFSGCASYSCVIHQTSSTFENTKPGEGFVIGLNETRSDVLHYLLDHTDIFMRFESDGKAHFYKDLPLEYEYGLDGKHTFFRKQDRRTAIIPNKVYVYSTDLNEETGESLYTGMAQDAISVGLIGAYCTHETLNVQSVAEANEIAAAILANIKATEKTAEAVVPMNCYALVYDKVKVTDEREGTTVEGHVGSLTREWWPGHYRMTIGFGGWFNARRMREFLKPYIGQPPGTSQIGDGGGGGFVASFPGVYLGPAAALPFQEWSYQTFVFGTPLVPGYGRLFLNAWSAYANSGAVKLEIYTWNGTAWVLAWNSEGEGFVVYPEPQLVYTNPFVNALPVIFQVVNPSKENPPFEYGVAAQHATGFIQYDVREAASE